MLVVGSYGGSCYIVFDGYIIMQGPSIKTMSILDNMKKSYTNVQVKEYLEA